MLQVFLLFTFNALLAAMTIRFSISLALSFGIADHVGGHKQHDKTTPFVGGVGVLVALLIALILLIATYPEQLSKWLTLGVASVIIFATGFADDLMQLNYKVRLIIQAIVAFIMVLAGGVVLGDLGVLFFGSTLELGLFAIPFTIFSVIGGINALNMIDGIDGLAGMLSLISLLLIAVVAFVAGGSSALTLSVALAGGLAAFLYYNLRYASQRRAQVFLGDNGSMLIGFLLAWMLIDLSQKPGSAMTPVTALWLFSIPLMDTLSVILRRVWVRRSPFMPDRTHLHHILLLAGFRIQDTVLFITSLHMLIGVTGIAGLYLEVSELVMLLGFLLIYAVYFYVTQRPWYFIVALRHLHAFLGLTPATNHGAYLGSYTAKEAANLVRVVSEELGPAFDSWVQVLERQSLQWDVSKRYAVSVNIRFASDDWETEGEVKQYVTLLQRRMMERRGIQMRQFVQRNNKNDRRIQDQGNPLDSELRISERRGSDPKLIVFEAMFNKRTPARYLPFETERERLSLSSEPRK
jgi:UDP-GlcNAc:undecaprenyl-phosphate/decaprenyl-phosphate GlcNAc-1-phosphate transferase